MAKPKTRIKWQVVLARGYSRLDWVSVEWPGFGDIRYRFCLKTLTKLFPGIRSALRKGQARHVTITLDFGKDIHDA